MRSAVPLLVLTLAIAMVGFAQPILAPGEVWRPNPAVSFGSAGIWTLLLIYGLIAHGKRARRLLIGAPFALFWPAGLAWLYLVCTFGPECL